MSWVGAVDYRRARPVRAGAQPCRDYGKLERLTGGLMIGAVADGADGAALSHIGAKTAVRSAIATLRGASGEIETVFSKADEADATALFECVLDNARVELQATAFNHVVRTNELACTLIAFVAGPAGLAAMQVGAGLIVCRAPEGAYDLLFRPCAKGDAAEPDDLLAETAPKTMQVCVRKTPVEFVCAATGGLQPVSLSRSGGGLRDPFFRTLDSYAAGAFDDGDVHRGIREFLRSNKLTKQAPGDITLALCRYKAKAAQHAAAD